MADNTQLNAGSGGDVIASDDIAGVKYQRVKLSLGADGAATDAPIGGGTESGVLRVTLASDSTGVLSIDDNGSTISVDDGAGSLTVDNAALAVTGGGVEASALRVTIANDSTGVVSVDDNGGSLTVDVGTALPAGDNNIGNVDVLSVIPGTGATNLGKAIDSAAGATDTGVAPLAIRDDSLSALTPAEGDWVPLRVNSTGALHVTGAGGGTQYNVDTAAGGTDTGTLALAVRDDALTTLTPVDGDYVPLRVTSTGALHVNVTGGSVAGIVDDAAFTPGTTEGVVFMAHADETTPDAVDEGDAGALRMTLNRALHINVRDDAGDSCMDGANNALRVNVVTGGGTGGTSATDDAAFTAASGSGTPIMGFASADTVDSGDVGVIAMTTARAMHVAVQGTVTVGSHEVTNAGTFATQVDGAALTALQLIDNSSIADDAAFTPGTTGVTMVGFTADETATDSVNEGDGGAARMTLDRKIIVTPYAHAAAGGHTPYKNLDVDESEDEVKGSGGKLFWLHAINLAATKRYLKIYNNTAAGTTVGTTVPDLTFPIPTLGDTNGAGFTINFGEAGIQLGTGITIAATTGFADNDTGAPGANEVIVNLGYT